MYKNRHKTEVVLSTLGIGIFRLSLQLQEEREDLYLMLHIVLA